MTKILTLTTTALLLCSAAAMAQTSTQGAAQSPAQPPAAGQMAPNSTSPANTTTVREQMSSSLKQAGFTDIHIVPDSYLVQAKDKSGNPVALFVGPNSVTEMVAEGSAGGANAFVSDAASDMLSSKIVGADVYDSSNQNIGAIKDLALKDGRVAAIVVSVGGFLHMGEHYVAIAPQSLNVSYGNGGKSVHVTTTATEAQLKAAPAFNYSNG